MSSVGAADLDRQTSRVTELQRARRRRCAAAASPVSAARVSGASRRRCSRSEIAKRDDVDVRAVAVVDRASTGAIAFEDPVVGARPRRRRPQPRSAAPSPRRWPRGRRSAGRSRRSSRGDQAGSSGLVQLDAGQLERRRGAQQDRVVDREASGSVTAGALPTRPGRRHRRGRRRRRRRSRRATASCRRASARRGGWAAGGAGVDRSCRHQASPRSRSSGSGVAEDDRRGRSTPAMSASTVGLPRLDDEDRGGEARPPRALSYVRAARCASRPRSARGCARRARCRRRRPRSARRTPRRCVRSPTARRPRRCSARTPGDWRRRQRAPRRSIGEAGLERHLVEVVGGEFEQHRLPQQLRVGLVRRDGGRGGRGRRDASAATAPATPAAPAARIRLRREVAGSAGSRSTEEGPFGFM